MSGTNQPQQVILNSKYKQSYETIDNITYSFETPIHNAVSARLTSFSTIYLVRLISPEQASLNFSVRTDTLEHDYNIDLTNLTNNYYNSLTELLDDLNNKLTAEFTSADPSNNFYTELKPTLSFNSKTLKILFNANQSTIPTTVKINSNDSNIWFKLGFINGIYDFQSQLISPSSPSIIPLNELYIEIDGLINETGRLLNYNTPTNNPKVVEVVTFTNVSIGDVFFYRSSNIPEYPLKTNSAISNMNIRLLNSLGQPVRLQSDYRLQLDFLY